MPNPILITVVLSVFIALLGVGIVIPVLPVLATTLGATGFTLGLITAAFSLSRGLLQPLVGNVSDRWGRKGFLMAGLLIYGIVGLVIPLATNVPHLIYIRLFQGIGAAMIVPVAMAYASFLAPPGQEGRSMGIINIAIFCGIGCGPIVGGFFSDIWGIPSVFYIMAVLCFAAFLLVITTLPSCSPIERKPPLGLWVSMQAMIRRKRTMGILLARFATVLMMVPTMAFLPVLMKDWPGSTGMQTGMVIASRTLMNAVLQYPMGKLADRHEKIPLLLLGAICTSLALVCIPFIHSFGTMVATYLFLGLGEAVLWPVLGAYAVEEGRAHYGHGTMMGVFNLAMSAGVFTGALLAGAGLDFFGMHAAFWLTALAIATLSFWAATLIRTDSSEVKTNATS
ncbi:MFS transporter [Desulfobulbus rhabdoformis]|nr:MFS transporter [Desulfobulbus rhabdoformis]